MRSGKVLAVRVRANAVVTSTWRAPTQTHLPPDQVVAGSAAVLESVQLHGCTQLTNTALLCLSRQCPRLNELDLTGGNLTAHALGP